MSEQSLKHNIPSGVHSRELNHKEARNTQHIVNKIFHVYIAGIMLGKLSRQLAIQLQEQRQNLKQGHLHISTLVQHDYEEGHWIGWNEANILQTRPNTRYRKYRVRTCGILGNYHQPTQF